MRHLLVLRHQRGGGDFSDHQAGIQSRLLREECRQAEGQRRIDQQRDAALGDRADLADGDRDLVGGEGDRLRVEIAAGHHRAVGQHQRVVGDGIRFDLQRAGRHAQQIEAGAIHLRLAADAIRVLHALVAFEMAVADFRPLQAAPAATMPRRSGPDGRAAYGFPDETARTSPSRRQWKARR